MSPINVVIASVQDAKETLKRAKDAVEDFFHGADVVVEVDPLPSLRDAARVTKLLLRWKAKVKNHVTSFTIVSLKKLRAANNTTRALRKAAVKIEEAGNLSADRRKRLRKMARSMAEYSNPLPLPVKRQVQMVCEDLKSAARGLADQNTLVEHTVARIHKMLNEMPFDPRE